MNVPLGFLSSFTAADLNGTWTLQTSLAPASNSAPISAVTLTRWSLALGARTIGMSTVPVTGSTPFTSSLVVSGQDPGLTGGRGGSISIHSASLEVVNGSSITTRTLGSGGAGNLAVESGSVTIAGGTISSDNALPPFGSPADQAGLGPAGSVQVDAAGPLSLQNSGEISAATMSLAAAGSVDVSSSSSVAIQSGGSINVAAPASIGGGITLYTPSLSMNAGSISAQALEAGRVTVFAPDIAMSAGASISSNTTNLSPNGSDVYLYTSNLTMEDSRITAATSGSGAGGSIRVGPGPGETAPAITCAARVTNRGHLGHRRGR